MLKGFLDGLGRPKIFTLRGHNDSRFADLNFHSMEAEIEHQGDAICRLHVERVVDADTGILNMFEEMEGLLHKLRRGRLKSTLTLQRRGHGD